MKIIQTGTGWFRVFGYGLSFSKVKTFSIRYGYVNCLEIFGWYITFLRPGKY